MSSYWLLEICVSSFPTEEEAIEYRNVLMDSFTKLEESKPYVTAWYIREVSNGDEDLSD